MVTIPRLEAPIEIDGRLDEAPWTQAARLAGFSQYRPVDSRPAEEQTEVRVWYSPTALYFGIIAHDSDPGSIRATVADRDNLSRDDTVTIYLDTFNDRRRAFVFGVNPLGAQEDGVHSEGAFNPGTLFGGTLDRNPDYQFDSRGRITADGYIVEVRIPFKSLRYPGTGPQRWGLNILRKVQRTGYEDTWTDVKRANSSFLVQAGTIDGLHDLKRGMVTEVQPFVTGAVNGVRPAAAGAAFSYEPAEWSPGVNVRVGFTNLSLDATLNPDFSQVESDAGQVTVNQRFALFFSEKRPFFLEGIELFSTPNQLVYTRRVVDPAAGGKFTGKFGGLGIAYLAARDEEPNGDDATVNIARVRRDLGTNSLAGVTFTDRTSASGYNRVLAADSRVVFKKLYYVQGQIGRSWTEAGGSRRDAPIWSAEFDRTGRAWGFNYKLNGIGESFETRSGYVPRSNIVEGRAHNRFTYYGGRGAMLETVTAFFGPTRIWRYAAFAGGAPIEGSDNLNVMSQWHGGWSLSSGLARQFVRFDRQMYARYQVARDGGLQPYEALEQLTNGFYKSVTLSTPTFRLFNVRVEAGSGDAAIFAEGSRGRETRLAASANFRPTSSIRLELTNTLSRITRHRDGSDFARTIIPRLKAEYQLTRVLFLRIVGEYRSQRQAGLRDARTGVRLLSDGIPVAAQKFDGLRLDCLFSYEPTPGTVAFFGYGSSLETDRVFTLDQLRRTSDGFFVKLAYQIRR
jgi:hypothetical protein